MCPIGVARCKNVGWSRVGVNVGRVSLPGGVECVEGKNTGQCSKSAYGHFGIYADEGSGELFMPDRLPLTPYVHSATRGRPRGEIGVDMSTPVHPRGDVPD